jgi:hypothetical protein
MTEAAKPRHPCRGRLRCGAGRDRVVDWIVVESETKRPATASASTTVLRAGQDSSIES